MKSAYKIVSVLIGVLFLFYFLHLLEEFPKNNVAAVFTKVNYWYVLGSFLAYLFSHFLRAIRIAVLMGRQDYSLLKLTYMQFYTNGINLIVPFKLGEVYRIVEFNKLIGDYKKLFLTIITEKTLDMLLLLVWALLAILFLGKEIVALNIVLWIISGLIFVSLIIFFVLPENIKTLNIFVAKRYNRKWVVTFLAVTDQISTVIANIKSTLRSNASTLMLLTSMIWIFEVLGFSYLLPFMVEKSHIWLLSIMVFLSSIIPSVSLGIGGLQLGFSTLKYASGMSDSLIISLTYQAFIFAPAVVLGVALRVYVNALKKKKASIKKYDR